MELLPVKLLAGLGIIVVTVIGGAIPLLAASRQVGWRFFSLGNAFAGGIFLGVGFIHLLPEGIHELEEVVDYPLGALLAAIGVGLLLLIDRVIFDRGHGHGHGEVPAGGAPQGAIYPYMLLVLLSIHSIAAGIALGLEEHLTTVIILVIGILSHQGSEAFAFVVSTHAAGLEARRQKIMLTILSLTVPVGILAGLATSTVLVRDERREKPHRRQFRRVRGGNLHLRCDHRHHPRGVRQERGARGEVRHECPFRRRRRTHADGGQGPSCEIRADSCGYRLNGVRSPVRRAPLERRRTLSSKGRWFRSALGRKWILVVSEELDGAYPDAAYPRWEAIRLAHTEVAARS